MWRKYLLPLPPPSGPRLRLIAACCATLARPGGSSSLAPVAVAMATGLVGGAVTPEKKRFTMAITQSHTPARQARVHVCVVLSEYINVHS